MVWVGAIDSYPHACRGFFCAARAFAATAAFTGPCFLRVPPDQVGKIPDELSAGGWSLFEREHSRSEARRERNVKLCGTVDLSFCVLESCCYDSRGHIAARRTRMASTVTEVTLPSVPARQPTLDCPLLVYSNGRASFALIVKEPQQENIVANENIQRRCPCSSTAGAKKNLPTGVLTLPTRLNIMYAHTSPTRCLNSILFAIFTSPRTTHKQAILCARILRARRYLTHGGGQSLVKRAALCRSPPRGAHLRKWSSSLHETLITALILGRRSCTKSTEKEAPARGKPSNFIEITRERWMRRPSRHCSCGCLRL